MVHHHQGVVPLIRGATDTISHYNDSITQVHGPEHCGEYTHVRLRPADDQAIGFSGLKMMKKLRLGKCRVARLIYNGSRRAEFGKWRRQFEQSEVNLFASRDLPACVITLPHAGHI